MIRIKSKKHLFRRCGIAHPAQAVEYPEGRFSKAELAVLKAEPMLIVEVIPDEQTGTGTGAAEDIAAMTVEQLKTAIAEYQPIEMLKGIKKAELAQILESHREAAAAKG
jgi:hypothetical protein